MRKASLALHLNFDSLVQVLVFFKEMFISNWQENLLVSGLNFLHNFYDYTLASRKSIPIKVFNI